MLELIGMAAAGVLLTLLFAVGVGMLLMLLTLIWWGFLEVSDELVKGES